MLPIVIDPVMRSQYELVGAVGFLLGTRVYVDMCTVTSDKNNPIPEYLVMELYERIIQKIRVPLMSIIEKFDLSGMKVLLDVPDGAISQSAHLLSSFSSSLSSSAGASATEHAKNTTSGIQITENILRNVLSTSTSEASEAEARLIDEMNTWFVENIKSPLQIAHKYSNAIGSFGTGSIPKLAGRKLRNREFLKENFSGVI